MPSSIGTRAGVFGFSMGLSVVRVLLLVSLLEMSLFPGVEGQGCKKKKNLDCRRHQEFFLGHFD